MSFLQSNEMADDGSRTRLHFPLYAKILLCLLLNISLALGVGVWLLRGHFGVGGDWLLNETARERLQAMSQVLAVELSETPFERWDSMVARTGEAHRVRMALFDVTGHQVAGIPMDLPEGAMERLRRLPVVPPHGGRRIVIRGETDGSAESGLWQPRVMMRHEDAPALGGEPDFPKEAFRTHDPDGYWFFVRLPHVQGPPMVAVGMTERLGETGLLFDPKPWLWAAAGVFGFSVLLWFPLVRSVTGSISEMTRATEQIAKGRFDTRVKEKRRDELGRLGGAINRMTARLEGFVAGQRRFMGDVAHELCSPMARMEVGIGVIEQRIPGEERSRLEEVRQELSEMRALVSELLAFSKADLESASAVPEPVLLEPLVRAAVEREVAGLRVDVRVPENVRVVAAPALLHRALANILRNAAQHAGDSSPIEISASAGRERVVLRVSDRGPGVSPEALPQLFDPFFRVDSSRSRETGGVGLGLAIVRKCTESCGGEATARNREGGGLIVELRLRPGGVLGARPPSFPTSPSPEKDAESFCR